MEIRQYKIHRCADNGLLWEFFWKEGFGQAAVRTVPPGVTAGGHKHPRTNEWWLIFEGQAVVYLEYPDGIREMLYVDADDSPRLIRVPAGTGHDIKNVGDGEVTFIFIADRIYDPKTHDKEPWSWE